LLQILQDRIFSPVGSHEKEHFKGRVIAATNKSIDELRLEGRFRDDFYYRLCSDCILVPSLKQRIDENQAELDELISHTVEQITGHKAPELDRTVKEVIDTELGKGYHWPGNVRELEQCIRRVIIKRSYQGDKIIKSMNEKRKLFSNIESGNLSAQHLITVYCQILYSKYGTYQDVARITGLDRRTVKKHINSDSA
jgi:transcriptional regulator with PAS, ATPase and Fis domain